MDYRERFINWWSEFQESDHQYIQWMKDTIEDSPYHREDNVFVHTQMVVSEYIKFVDVQGLQWKYEDLQGAVACVFHDVGKPDSEEEEYSEKYDKVIRRYKGHEIISAGYWMDFWCNNEFNIRSLIDDINAFYNVWVLVAYHLPYQLGDKNLSIFKTHVQYFGIEHVLGNVLLADCHGRVQDQRRKEIQNCYDWIDFFGNVNTIDLNDNDSEMQVLIGVPASGKSYYATNKDAMVFSYDGVREALFPNAMSYREVFIQCEDYFNDESREPNLVYNRLKIGKPNKLYGYNETLQMAMRDAYDRTPLDTTLIIDNTSLSRKYRRIINSINKHERKVHAYMFVRSLNELYENEESRDDNQKRGKSIIKSMYFRYFPALIGEVDDVTLVPPRNY